MVTFGNEIYYFLCFFFLSLLPQEISFQEQLCSCRARLFLGRGKITQSVSMVRGAWQNLTDEKTLLAVAARLGAVAARLMHGQRLLLPTAAVHACGVHGLARCGAARRKFCLRGARAAAAGPAKRRATYACHDACILAHEFPRACGRCANKLAAIAKPRA